MNIGQVYLGGLEALRAKKAAAPSTVQRALAENDILAFQAGWGDFQIAAWSFLWTMREKVVFSFSVLGVTLARKRFEDLRGIWKVAFGPCPFGWEVGPNERP